jgi:hypothetical protein
MTRQHRTPNTLVRRLRRFAFGLAAAAAVHDPSLLLALHAATAPRRSR